MGEWTVHNETGDVDTCYALPTFAREYLSVAKEAASTDPGWVNCTTTLDTDSACTLGAALLALDTCVDCACEFNRLGKLGGGMLAPG